jgi:hypothetical protein
VHISPISEIDGKRLYSASFLNWVMPAPTLFYFLFYFLFYSKGFNGTECIGWLAKEGLVLTSLCIKVNHVGRAFRVQKGFFFPKQKSSKQYFKKQQGFNNNKSY